ncbi:hypothetical protein AURDEDRAFT_179933 [Auricularia subglabra TFB-10046 SS5]|nr:hypothetical protein AURDEDRAFT_179933 [Auricularia subglabra TFB-10046 SS5]
MDDFTQDHSAQLLGKDWLVKSASDGGTAMVPYLFKVATSLDNLTCCMIISDTKRVWADVLDGKQVLRRWCALNPNLPSSSDDSAAGAKEAQRSALAVLDAIHTLRNISIATFSIVQSPNADLACEIGCEDYTWQWHANAVGYRTSSELLSKHLILPLISFSHVAFTAPQPLQQMPADELEKLIDKTGRIYRRSVDAQVKKVLAEPKLGTALSRIDAIFGMQSDPPAIKTDIDDTGPEVPEPQATVKAAPLKQSPKFKPQKPARISSSPPARLAASSPAKPPAPASSETETESEADSPAKPPPAPNASAPADDAMDTSDVEQSKPAAKKTKKNTVPESDTDSSPVAKKAKPSTDSDSESSPVRRPAARGGGVRQPIKRGGRRF